MTASTHMQVWFAALLDEVRTLGTDGAIETLLGVAPVPAAMPAVLALTNTATTLRRDLALSATGAADAAVVVAALPTLLAQIHALQESGLGVGPLRPGALAEALVLRAFEYAMPSLHALLDVFGVIDLGPPLAIDWDAFGALIADPIVQLRTTIWAEQFERSYPPFLEGIGQLLRGAGIPMHIRTRDDLGDSPIGEALVQLDLPLFEGDGLAAGLVLAPFAAAPGEPVSGLIFTNYGSFTRAVPLELGHGWSLTAAGAIDADRMFSAKLAPGVLVVETRMPQLDLSAALAWAPVPEMDADGEPVDTAQTEPAWISLGGAAASVALRGSIVDPELVFEVTTVRGDQEAGLVFSFDNLSEIPLIGTLLGDRLGASLDLALSWSSRSGLTFNGSAKLQTETFPPKGDGPFHIDRVAAGISPIPGGFTTLLTVDAGARLGPLDIVALDFGMALDVAKAEGNAGTFGPIDLALRPRPPAGLGLSIDAPLISGGGLLLHTEGRWFGAAELSFGKSIGLSAIGLAERSGDEPWSLLLSLALRTGSIPLAFGFTLDGVGGLLGLHRGFDVQSLAQKLKAGELQSILFPVDPVAEATTVLAGLSQVFPRQEGQHVVGPFVKLGWGPGIDKVLQADLGILVSFPDLVLALVGQVRIALPPGSSNPIGLLQVTILGAWEPAEHRVWLLGSLVGSYIGPLQLSGEAAFYLAYGEQPYFLLSLGGYHPDWKAPASLPSSVASLQRLGARLELGENVEVTLEAYFALTSNSLQVGACFKLEAEADLGIARFRIVGTAEFNVLVVFSPLRIDADWELAVGVFLGNADNELCGATLYAHVQGPDPWFANGYAEFRALGAKVRFPIEIGSRRSASEPPKVNVLEDHLVPALRAPDAWLTERSGDGLVLLREDVEPGDTVSPESSLRLRQTIVPLGQLIEHFGEAALVGGPTTFAIASAGLDHVEAAITDVVDEEFAPGTFFSLSHSERLAAPSFERFECGRRFDGATRSADDALDVPSGFDEALVDPLAPAEPTLPSIPTLPVPLRPSKSSPLFKVKSPTYTVDVAGTTVVRAATYMDAVRAARAIPNARVATGRS